MKFIFLRVSERMRDMEFETPCLTQLRANQKVLIVLDRIVASWRGEHKPVGTIEYETDCCVASIGNWREITQEEFTFLKRFIADLTLWAGY